MSEHPILFSGPMVRAILEGRKTMTRRVVKPQPYKATLCEVISHPETTKLSCKQPAASAYVGFDLGSKGLSLAYFPCPYGKVGDRLWVRETWADLRPYNGIAYKADVSKTGIVTKWKPSIHMPRWASRITLEITGVRVERVQEITKQDIWNEGVTESDVIGDSHGAYESWHRPFIRLWDSINKKRGFGWDVNPWCWVIEFKRIEKGGTE